MNAAEQPVEGLSGPAEPGRQRPWRRIARGARYPLRAAAVALAAGCAAGAITGRAGTAAAVVGAALGVAAGELIARRRARLWAIAAAALGLAVLGWLLAGACTRYQAVPMAIGPGTALRLSAILRFGLTSFAVVAFLRAAGRRMGWLAVLELVAMVAAFAVPFAAHRDGVVVRPLWLSDWAWHEGIDPSLVLLALGAGVAGVLALLLMLESERRPGLTSFLALPALAALLAFLVHIAPPPPPRPANDLGLTTDGRGDAPRDSGRQGEDLAGQGGSGQGQPQQGQGQQQQGQGQGQQGQGQQQQGQGQGQQGQQGQGQQQQQQQGQGQGQGTPPPSESDWNDPSDGEQSAPMAVVLLGDDWTPTEETYYFRQEAWSEYTGARLIAPRQRGRDADLPSDLPSGTLAPPAPLGTPGTQLIHADVALLVSHRRLFFLGAPTKWEPLSNPDPSRFVRAYRFEAAVSTRDFKDLLGREVGEADWTPELKDYYLARPTDPRYAALVEEILAKLPEERRADPFVRAAAIKRYLDENSTYSTRHRHAGVADPTADFLFGDRIGYCVHFAHAATYLWRAAGIPARIGVGYAAAADNRRGSSILIRGGDAHAWPELYLRGIGWVVLDIAPAKNLDPPGTPPDDDMQLRLAELARGATPEPTSTAPEQPFDDTSFFWPIVLGSAGLIGSLLLGLYAVKLWRRVAPRFAGAGELPRVGYRSALDALSASGRWRDRGETREKFAGRVVAQAPAFQRVTDLHLAARFAPGPASPQKRDEWLTLLDQVRRELAGRVPLWRRVLRALNPISFFVSR